MRDAQVGRHGARAVTAGVLECLPRWSFWGELAALSRYWTIVG